MIPRKVGICVLSICWFFATLVLFSGIFIYISFDGEPLGCSFGDGCEYAGALYQTKYFDEEEPKFVITGSFEDGEEWKYYSVELNNEKEQTLSSYNITGNICLGENSFVKPNSCNIPLDDDYDYSTNDGLICVTGTRMIVIGVKNEEDAHKAQDFSFELLLQNPFESTAGFWECGYDLLFFVICPTVIVVIWVLTLIICTLCFLFKGNHNTNEYSYSKELDDFSQQ